MCVWGGGGGVEESNDSVLNIVWGGVGGVRCAGQECVV